MAVGVTCIASEIGVSKGLVSRYLNADPTLRISPTTSRRIEDARKSLGIPNATSSTLKRRKRLMRCFAIPVNYGMGEGWPREMMNSPFIQNVEKIVTKEKFRLSAIFFHEEKQQDFFESLMTSGRLCDGLLLGNGVVDAKLARLILKRRFPHVCVDSNADNHGLNTVYAHASIGMRQAATHLLELGHKRIDYLSDAGHRYPNYVAVMAELGLPMTDGFCQIPALQLGEDPGHQRELAKGSFGKWLDRGHAATAVMCHNDMVAFGAIDAMRERGLEPGRDISVVGYDNSEERGRNRSPEPFLTTVDNPTDIIGQRCGEVLLGQVLGNQNSKRITHQQIPVKLVIRKTTGIAKDSLRG